MMCANIFKNIINFYFSAFRLNDDWCYIFGSRSLPAIVNNINGCNEIIVDGENGLIIPVKDANALYLAMKSLVTDTNLTLSLKDKSRAMIASRFEQQVVWDAILAAYKRLKQYHV